MRRIAARASSRPGLERAGTIRAMSLPVPGDRDFLPLLDEVEQLAELIFCLEGANDFHRIIS
jgi:hypothetical protein